MNLPSGYAITRVDPRTCPEDQLRKIAQVRQALEHEWMPDAPLVALDVLELAARAGGEPLTRGVWRCVDPFRGP